LKILNRSLKSELANIKTLNFGVVYDQFPSRSETRLWRLSLPEEQIK